MEEPDVPTRRSRGPTWSKNALANKWGWLLAGAGYTSLPNHLIWINLYAGEKEKLSPTELLVLITVISTWWDSAKWPTVAKSFIARRTNLSDRHVQRSLTALERKGYIKRVAGVGINSFGTNSYDLSGCLEKAEAAAKAAELAKQEAATARAELAKQVQTSLESRGWDAPRGDLDDDIPF